ncbi:DNA mismatch repair protein MutS [Desulfotomaculum copahuensis]|uniref:DNA mismatch repair protein MutS n=1 Tax=Desulfotomaculum copahuensis TaxID=1838280 RepID=A0A1B7LEC8_9FIRM|nr:DNA mismatch repair protein MutS [Desulfotomaculum copahuensis]OAT81459.1 DNA mismatch repair protein MutS [Desulfotomaculum copahuensis]
MAFTPMMKQYLQIKQNYQDAILFFRLGDFYEMFFDDALTASRELEITLTGREAGEAGRVPMCGVPYHAAGTYISRLTAKGFKVAVCDQIEEAGSGRGIVRREVTRVVTPGTVLEGLEDKRHNFLLAVAGADKEFGLAAADVTTGLLLATQLTGEKAAAMLLDEVARLEPAEVLLAGGNNGDKLAAAVQSRLRTAITTCDAAVFLPDGAGRMLDKHFGPAWAQRFGLHNRPLAVRAAGGLLAYLNRTQKNDLRQFGRIQVYSAGQYMMLDTAARRNLELTASLRDGSRWGTLLWVLDHTLTAMGGRLLKTWIERPLLVAAEINERLDAVAELAGDVFLRDALRRALNGVHDMERLAARVVYGTANARDLLALKGSLAALPAIKSLLAGGRAALFKRMCDEMDEMTDLYRLLQTALNEDPPVSVREGGLIRDGYHSEVDSLRMASRDGKKWLAGLEAAEKERTGIRSLKVGFNKVFGYYLEVTRANLELVPADYIRKQTLANVERFITPELKKLEETILGAEDRLVQLEYRLFTEIREQVAGQVRRIQRTAGAVACVDALYSLAEAAVKGNYVRPQVDDCDRLVVREGRHPVIEQVLARGEFVPNDVRLDDRERLIILTGPNMAGKSTYMRQVALLVLMAQAGSFIPAAQAQIGVVDRIFTRVGASDDLAAGQSTFMVEMSECQTIVSSATRRSLVIMDEVGRGTSTYDGISIARALVEYLVCRVGAKTLFSTHYHELTDLDCLPGVRNYTVKVQEQGEEVVFLRRVLPGRADRSYGIQVARLAGLPAGIVERAREILLALECRRESAENTAVVLETPDAARDGGVRDVPVTAGAVLTELASLNALDITPLEALNFIVRWHEMLTRGDENAVRECRADF